MEVSRLRLAFLLAGVILVGGGVAAGSFGQHTRESLDHTLSVETEEHAAGVKNYFDRARDIALLTAQNPALAQFYAAPGDRAAKITDRPDLVGQANAALAYLQVLYPGRIGEACFIDRGGAENARVVGTHAATVDELSSDESHNRFFAPTFALPVGQVFQARPYVSPDTNEWVISNSTPVPTAGGPQAIVHFEVTVESMRLAMAPDNDRYTVQILDRATGQVVIDSRIPQRIGAPLGGPSDGAYADVAALEEESGLLSVGGRRVAFERLTSGAKTPTAETPGAVNDNDWIMIVSTPGPQAVWAGVLAPGPLGLITAGLLCLLLAGLGYHRHHRQLHAWARTDDLTGLGNRLRLRESIAAAVDSPTARAAVLLMDLDRFKAVNDTLGHHAGDQLLVEVADRLRRAMPPTGLVARLGGDEFAVLITDLDDENEPARIAAHLRQVVRETMTLEGVAISISTSIGIAIAPRHGNSPRRLLRCADVAMYHAKRTAGGHCTYAEEQERHSPETLGMEAALLAAIERRQLLLHYQPSIDPATGAVLRVEALVRWQHPELGLIPPMTFLPLAEETGMMHGLTRYVLETALDQAAVWRADGLDLQVSVNLSPANCVDTDLPDDVATMLAARKLPSGILRLEITEHAALASQATQVLNRLHELGITLALDDFGTGYSSLSYLKQLPIDEVKIDRSFVAALERDRTDSVIIQATIGMAHRLGHKVTAEGVENADSLRELRTLGADAIQGYHVCRPLPADDLLDWLHRTRPQPTPTASPMSDDTTPAIHH